MKWSRALSSSIFYFSVCWGTHDPQLPIFPTNGTSDQMVTLTFHFPLVVCTISIWYQHQFLTCSHMLYPSRYWLEVSWGDKKRACSLNCPRPWRCHLAADVNLMVPFAAHSKPLDYHHPTTLFFCIFVFLCVRILKSCILYMFVIYFVYFVFFFYICFLCICEDGSCLCC